MQSQVLLEDAFGSLFVLVPATAAPRRPPYKGASFCRRALCCFASFALFCVCAASPAGAPFPGSPAPSSVFFRHFSAQLSPPPNPPSLTYLPTHPPLPTDSTHYPLPTTQPGALVPAGAVLDRGLKGWVEAIEASRHYLYPLHATGGFLQAR